MLSLTYHLLVSLLLFSGSVRGDFGELFDFTRNLDIDEPLDVDKEIVGRSGPLLFNPDNLDEFKPIRSTIIQSDLQYFSFAVNSTTGIGRFYEYLIFITGNICSQPIDLNATDPSLALYYSFNSTMFEDIQDSQMILFQDGYVEGLADVASAAANESTLYIAVRAPENTNRTASWTYEIAASQNNLVFQWDDRSWASLVDADDDSALVVTGQIANFSGNVSSFNPSNSRYDLYLYDYAYKDYFSALSKSWCAVREGPAIMSTNDFEVSYTERGGGIKQQFFIAGLNESTTYVAYLVSDFEGDEYGGSLYQPFDFETMESGACELVFDLEFCDQVAYSVPLSSNIVSSPGGGRQLMNLYDDYASDIYTNFSKALQQIACDTESDAVYSPVRTCADCSQSYKDWLCSVSIPRCATSNNTGFKYRAIGDSRNDYINEVIIPPQPYFEILPCVNVCEAIVRDCPSDFGFLCPTTNASTSLSYFWDITDDYISCNYVGPSSSYALRVFVDYSILLFGAVVNLVFFVL